MRIDDFQFGAMMVTALLTLTLVAQVPFRVARTVNRARWLLVCSLLLLFVQFLLQYIYGFRSQGVTQGVAVNLLFLIPCTWLMNVAMLYLQRRGTMSTQVWLMGPLCLAVTIMLFAVTAEVTVVDGRILLSDTPSLRMAEYISAFSFCAILIWYYDQHRKEHRKLKQALDNFNDADSNKLLGWMHNSMLMLAGVGMLLPFALFLSGYLLGLTSILFFCAFYYCIISFYRYSVSSTPELVEEAQQENAMEEEEETGIHTETVKNAKAEVAEAMMLHVEEAVAQWTERKGYLHKKATLQRVADELGVSRNQLSVWLKNTGLVFNPWINNLRIEEAKRMLREHSEWSNDSIASQCGFGSRSYFQTVFKENTGMTPAQFVEAQ